MEILNVCESLFHGIRDTQKKDAIEVLEDILMSGSLLTHESLRKKGIIHEREGYSHQGSKAISLCFHPKNLRLFQEFKDTGITLNHEKPAFIKYVNIEKPSIIFDPNLLSELQYRQFGGYPRTVDEIQILEDIPLCYMQAIGFNLDNMPVFKQKQILTRLRDLLSKYHYDKPVINPNTGLSYEEIKLIK